MTADCSILYSEYVHTALLCVQPVQLTRKHKHVICFVLL